MENGCVSDKITIFSLQKWVSFKRLHDFKRLQDPAWGVICGTGQLSLGVKPRSHYPSALLWLCRLQFASISTALPSITKYLYYQVWWTADKLTIVCAFYSPCWKLRELIKAVWTGECNCMGLFGFLKCFLLVVETIVFLWNCCLQVLRKLTKQICLLNILALQQCYERASISIEKQNR